MNHPEAELMEFVANELDAVAAAAVRRHLAGCPDCRATVAQLAALDATMAALPRLAPPPDFVAQVTARAMPAARRSPWWAALALVAGLLAMLPSLDSAWAGLSALGAELAALNAGAALRALEQLSGQLEATLVLGAALVALACVLIVVQLMTPSAAGKLT